MKIRNIVKRLALVGATAALLPLGSALAGGPGFDNIVLQSGTTGTLIGCPTGNAADCTPLIDGEGFLQQEVVVDGQTYIQTIIVDPLSSNASGNIDVSTLAFSDITFIQMSGSNNGIKAMQRLRDDPLDNNGADTTGNLFEGTTQLLIGAWAIADEPAGTANLQITQNFRDNSGTGTAIGSGTDASQTEDDFVNDFTLDINLDTAGVQTGKRMDMLQDVGMSDPTVTSPGDDFQRFVIRQRSGDLIAGAGTIVLGTPSAGTGTGGSVDWTGTDDVMVTWLGQSVNLGGSGSSIFGFQSVDNLSDSDEPISTFSTSEANFTTSSPFSWDATNFGTAPSLP
ncbi:hypothetical protein MNBD_GAMMA17-753 [hydrothermal vent metagenome]|uniref:Uncharacterized protein n=1 Tax=hydrothermal vent metagenome TaxID=652676 RepID=A0A3B0ZKS2_9ZZZZ